MFPTLSFNTYFNLDTGQVYIQDTSSYSYPGDDPNLFVGVLKIVGPIGLVYSNSNYNSPDIILGNTTISGNINLPKDQYGFVLQGTYTITYSVLNTVSALTGTQTNTYEYTFTVPVPDIELIPDGYDSTFTANDNTQYEIPLTIERTFTVTPPSSLSPQTTSGEQIIYSPKIWSGEWTSSLTSVLNYNIGGINVSITIEGSAEVYVYSVNISEIETLIEDFRLLYITESNINKALANSISNTLTLINTSYTEYQLALQDNNLLEAYNQALNIINLLNDYEPTSSVEIIPFV